MKKYKRAVELCLENLEIQIKVVGAPTQDTCRELIRYAKKEKSTELEGLAHYYCAHCHFSSGEHEEVLNHMTEAIRYLENTEHYDKLAKAYNVLAILTHGQHNLVLAVGNYMTALEYCKKYNSTMEKRLICSNLADAFYRMGDYEKAIEYYKVCADDFHKEDNKEYWGERYYLQIMSAYGYCLVTGGRFEEAQRLEEELWELLYYHSATATSKLSLYVFFATMRNYYGDKERAIEYIDIAIDILKKTIEITSQFDAIQNLMDYLVLTEDVKRLEEVLNFLEPQVAMENNEGFFIQLLMHRMRYCICGITQEEHLAYAKQFFRLRQQYEIEENKKILKTVELQTKLQEMREEQQKLHNQNEEVLQKSLHDELTGLPNRGYFNTTSERMLNDAWKRQESFGAVIVDVDYFKKYNYVYGQLQGERCITRVAETLRRVVGETGFIARYDEDEFVLLFMNLSLARLQSLMEEIKTQVEQLCMEHKEADKGIVSITKGGVMRIPRRHDRLWDFMSEADQALYYQKMQEKGNYYLAEKFGA